MINMFDGKESYPNIDRVIDDLQAHFYGTRSDVLEVLNRSEILQTKYAIYKVEKGIDDDE